MKLCGLDPQLQFELSARGCHQRAIEGKQAGQQQKQAGTHADPMAWAVCCRGEPGCRRLGNAAR
jgi:hypothetical protein